MRLTIDYHLEQLEERLAHVNELPLEKYSSHQLEVVANYLLQKAPMEGRRSYQIVTQLEYDKCNKHKEHRADLDVYNEEVLQIVKCEGNHYINTAWEITTKDINEQSLMGEILREYNEYILRLKKLKDEGKIHFKQYQRIVGEIRNDMLIVKKIFKGYAEKKAMPKWLGETFDYELVDYTDSSHVKAILRGISLDSRITPNKTISLIAEDMRATIKALYDLGRLTDRDVAIVQGLNRGYTLQELEEVVDMQYSGINKRFNKVCDKITQFYHEKEMKKVEKFPMKLDKKAA